MRAITALRAAGDSNPGLQRDVNEDRFHVDVSRGLFIVVDGIGGQAAGGKAADLTLSMLRTRLERETGTIADRVREAITVANNEVHRVASMRAEWNGMACVLTLAIVDEGYAFVGHVGDTRLYKLRDGRIEKITHDHSPVGEREDAGEISEFEAMRHPRRNEVYRDVGSEPHETADPDFIDLHEISFEPDAALLICSDGLTDLVESTTINQIVAQFAGQPQQVVKALVQAANRAGGKDNVTVVYVEGEQFRDQPTTLRADRRPPDPVLEAPGPDSTAKRARSRRTLRIALVALVSIVIALSAWRLNPTWSWPQLRAIGTPVLPGGAIVVRPGESIALALERAGPGSLIVVEPGEYRERVVLRNGVRVISRVPRGATIRLPGTASEGDPAVVADGITGAELAGFRIVGDAATPLGTGLFAKDADVYVVDVEISGAATVAMDLNSLARVSVVGSDIHDNPGTAMAIRAGASPRIAHTSFVRNGLSERVGAALIIESDTQPQFRGNVFHGIAADAFRQLGDATRARVMRDNWFPDGQESRTPSSAPARGRRDR